jgi:hypothetical protein
MEPPQTSRPNQPIRPPSPLQSSPTHLPHHPPPWSRSLLGQEREAFFDTRVSGNDEVWKAIRVVCEEVRKGNVAEAQAIIDALGITCPSGRIVSGRRRVGERRSERGGLYDERGEMYEIPAWVVMDPEDVVEDLAEDGEKDVVAGAPLDGAGDPGQEDAEAAEQRRDEKGKGRAEDPGEIVHLRARLSDRGTDIVISVGMKQKIAEVVRKIREQIGDKRVRLMYLGKPLDERTTLEESSWREGNVVNAMVFEGDESMLAKGGKK